MRKYITFSFNAKYVKKCFFGGEKADTSHVLYTESHKKLFLLNNSRFFHIHFVAENAIHNL